MWSSFISVTPVKNGDDPLNVADAALSDVLSYIPLEFLTVSYVKYTDPDDVLVK